MWLAPGHPSGWGRAKTGTQALDSSVRSFHHPFPPCLALSLVRTAPQSSSALARYLGSESFCISFLLSLCVFFSLSSFQGENLVSSSLKRERKKNPIWSVTHMTRFPYHPIAQSLGALITQSPLEPCEVTGTLINASGVLVTVARMFLETRTLNGLPRRWLAFRPAHEGRRVSTSSESAACA